MQNFVLLAFLGPLLLSSTPVFASTAGSFHESRCSSVLHVGPSNLLSLSHLELEEPLSDGRTSMGYREAAQFVLNHFSHINNSLGEIASKDFKKVYEAGIQHGVFESFRPANHLLGNSFGTVEAREYWLELIPPFVVKQTEVKNLPRNLQVPGENFLFHVILFSNLTEFGYTQFCLLYTSPSPRDRTRSRMPSSA